MPGMLEMFTCYVDLDYLNRTGFRSINLMVLSKTIYAAKNTLSRILVIMVCLGYGIVKPNLGANVKRILLAGITYFIFALIYGITHSHGMVFLF